MTTAATQILVFDPQIAGLSGDMVVGALLDLGANATRVIEAMKTPEHCLSGCKSLEITAGDTTRRGIRAKKVEINVEEEITQRTGAELLEAISLCMQKVEVSEKARQFALNAINTVVSVEAGVHGQSTQEVHLHETASADTLADVIGSAVALDDLCLFANTTVYSTPVAVGGGLFQFSHGTMSAPAPATQEILRDRGLLMIGGPVEAELATPTGVSILANLAPQSTRFYPPMKPTRVGYGAGTKESAEMPNVLRITIGEPYDYGLLSEEVYVIETNLDDVTGEAIAHSMDRLLHEGAKDVSVVPVLAKKGRPGYIVRIIADSSSLEHLCALLIEETGTLGVRMYPCQRRILARDFVPIKLQVENMNEIVNVKVARTAKGKIVQIKPEYNDVKRLADKTGKPLRFIEELVRRKATENLEEH